MTVATVTGIIIDVSTLEIWQADVAQLVEQPLRKWSVRGSSPLIGFFYCLKLPQLALEAVRDSLSGSIYRTKLFDSNGFCHLKKTPDIKHRTRYDSRDELLLLYYQALRTNEETPQEEIS